MVAFYEDIIKFLLTTDFFNQFIFFEPQTKLNFSLNNPNNFYILTSNTITDKFTSVRDLRKLFRRGLFSTRFPLTTLTEFIFISCWYSILNDCKQISIWMRLSKNLLPQCFFSKNQIILAETHCSYFISGFQANLFLFCSCDNCQLASRRMGDPYFWVTQLSLKIMLTTVHQMYVL